MKTNAARLLDKLSIPYELLSYAVDPADLAAESIAAKLQLPPDQVFKTLIARGDRSGICLAVIPGNAELDLKDSAAPCSGWPQPIICAPSKARLARLPGIRGRGGELEIGKMGRMG
jgi:hypothetical protein